MKILASDFDGTLNNRGDWPELHGALRRWKEAGNVFGVVSGRGVNDILSHVRECGVECDFLLGDSGSTLSDGKGNVVDRTVMPGILSRTVIGYLFEVGCEWATVRGDREYWIRSDTASGHGEKMLFRDTEPLGWFSQVSTSLPTVQEADEVISLLGKRFGDTLNFLRNGTCIDIVRGDMNKAVGLKKLFGFFGAGKNDIITVGDNVNDADMIREYRSYAVENAVREIRELAGTVVPGVTDLINLELEQ